ncbi:calycin-like domain-containing protein, partial [Treponema sp.]|uniref:calycin-like domain-containing protein n=1 Tax=Treponema sp. TaxID=166 RepID=UPI002600D8F3
SHSEDGATLDSAATTVTFTTDGKVYFSVTAMASMADPAELTYSSDSTEVPEEEEEEESEKTTDETPSEETTTETVLTLADYVAGTYSGSGSCIVFGVTSDSVDSQTITKTADEVVSITIPELTGMKTIPTFDIPNVTVTYADGVYTLSGGDTSVYVESEGKTVTISSLEGTVTDGVLSLKIEFKYGLMPFSSTYTFSS